MDVGSNIFFFFPFFQREKPLEFTVSAWAAAGAADPPSSSFPAIPVRSIEVAHRPSPTHAHSLSLGSLSLSLPTPWTALEHLPFAGRIHELPSMDFKSTTPNAQPPP